jgi:VIT1/CCC1 family predicted Fe2+/Mn2+ transporter
VPLGRTMARTVGVGITAMAVTFAIGLLFDT